jgi:hypothetical protein
MIVRKGEERKSYYSIRRKKNDRYKERILFPFYTLMLFHRTYYVRIFNG